MRPFVIGLIASLLLWLMGLPSQAQTSDAHGNQFNFESGIDNWQIQSSVQNDQLPGYVNNYSDLFLPNSYINWTYRSTSAYVHLNTTSVLQPDLTLNVRLRADQTVGTHFDSLSLDKQISPLLGFRVGIIPYNTNWCRTYDTDNPWIREINPLCSTNANIDITGGAPGISAYTNIPSDNFVTQTFIGVFEPLIGGYAPKEFGTTVTSNSMNVTNNRKFVLSTNLLHLDTGIEARLAYLQADQHAKDDSIDSQNHQAYHSIYLGLNWPISLNQQIRYTFNTRDQTTVCLSPTAPMAVCNLYHKSHYDNQSLEWNYQWDSHNVFAIAYDIYGVNTTEINYNNTLTLYQTLDPDININSTLFGVAWRHEWSSNLFSAVEFYHTSGLSKYLGLISAPSDGSALGIRLAYKF
jgi:hypothetical protein